MTPCLKSLRLAAVVPAASIMILAGAALLGGAAFVDSQISKAKKSKRNREIVMRNAVN